MEGLHQFIRCGVDCLYVGIAQVNHERILLVLRVPIYPAAMGFLNGVAPEAPDEDEPVSTMP